MKIKNIIYVSIIIVLFAAPLVFFDLHPNVSSENREATPFPTLPTTLKDINKGVIELDNWFNDRVGFRKQIIRAYRETHFHLLNELSSPLFAVGKNGAVFWRGEAAGETEENSLIMQSFVGRGEDWETSVDTTGKILKKNADFLHPSTNILQLSIPQAALFRYDQLPDYLQMQIDKSLIDTHATVTAYNAFKKEYPQNISRFFMYPYEEAKELAKRSEIFPEKNFHWTHNSPYLTLVADLITAHFGQKVINPFSLDLFQHCQTHSDVERLAGIDLINNNTWCITNDYFNGQKPFPVTRLPLDGKLADIPLFVQFAVNDSVEGGRILVVGNSFVEMMAIPLARNFREVLCINVAATAHKYASTKRQKIQDIFEIVKKDFNPEFVVVVSHLDFWDLPSLLPELSVFFPEEEDDGDA